MAFPHEHCAGNETFHMSEYSQSMNRTPHTFNIPGAYFKKEVQQTESNIEPSIDGFWVYTNHNPNHCPTAVTSVVMKYFH